MAQPAFGFLLQRLREERGLSLRELAQLADIDHAYIYRLETGDKESPSDEVITKLARALKAGKREASMLRYVAQNPQSDPGFIDHVLSDQSITYEVFASAAGMVHRGTGRPDYERRVAMVRKYLEEENANE